MRLYGMIKIGIALLVDFVIMYCILGIEPAVIITIGIMLYAWLDEYIALIKDRSISLKNLNQYEKNKLIRAHECLTEDVKRTSGVDISKLKLHMIPSDNINAYAYGFNNVAITRSALISCDDTTLCSVLGHEISHILNLDAVFNRVIFANVTLVIVSLIIGSFVSISFMWIIFLMLCAFGVCGGMFSVLVFHGAKNLVSNIFRMFQHLVVFIYQAVMGIVSRRCEFRADKYSCQLGYGAQLSYFLTRFVEGKEVRKQSVKDILYASHPATYKRVQRIEQNDL